MKKLLGILFIGGSMLGCGKVIEYSNDFGTANFINAAIFSVPATGFADTTMRIFVDTSQKTTSAVAYRGSTGYLAVAPGTRNVQVRSSFDLLTNFVEANAETFTANTASTYVIYDTMANASSKLKLARLNDTLTLPGNGFIKLRFLPLAPNVPDMDITFLRTSATPNDSITFFNQSYIGGSPSEATIQALSAFRTAPLGTYTMKLKLAGTQTVLGAQPLSVANVAGTAGMTGINTLYITGNAKGKPLSVGITRHYP